MVSLKLQIINIYLSIGEFLPLYILKVFVKTSLYFKQSNKVLSVCLFMMEFFYQFLNQIPKMTDLQFEGCLHSLIFL